MTRIEALAVTAAVALALAAGMAIPRADTSGPECGDACAVVNGVTVAKVRYKGELLPIQDFHGPAAVTVIASLSAETGYVWAFETAAEAEEFERRLGELERNCWVPGRCVGGQPAAAKPVGG